MRGTYIFDVGHKQSIIDRHAVAVDIECDLPLGSGRHGRHLIASGKVSAEVFQIARRGQTESHDQGQTGENDKSSHALTPFWF